MLKVPLKLIDFDLIEGYCIGENATAYKKGENVIFEFTSETEDYEWEEGEGWLSSLISLRSDIIGGDYRSLYLGWLYCAQNGDFEDDEPEPPVPPHLADLNASLKSFVDFMRIETDLMDVASETSISKNSQAKDEKELKVWINNLPEKEKDEILFRLVNGDNPYLGAEIKIRFQQTISAGANEAMGGTSRTVGYLIERSETIKAEKKLQFTKQKEKERVRREREEAMAREKYLNDLSKREGQIWEKVSDLIETRKPSQYDEAVSLLVDLRDLSNKIENEKTFKDKFQDIRAKHSRKPSFIQRLLKAGLDA
jgi:hypothetical protein